MWVRYSRLRHYSYQQQRGDVVELDIKLLAALGVETVTVLTDAAHWQEEGKREE